MPVMFSGDSLSRSSLDTMSWIAKPQSTIKSDLFCFTKKELPALPLPKDANCIFTLIDRKEE